MNILFIGYWDLQDPLTLATIFPHLKILSSKTSINKIVFSNTQRVKSSKELVKELNTIGVLYEPLFSKNYPVSIFNKIVDFLYFPKKLVKICSKYKIDKIIARGAPAGALAYLVWKETKTPFLVESFEPHADYMYESGVWKKWDPRYFFQKRWEKKIIECSSGIMPVTNNYTRHLILNGVDKGKLRTVPCLVQMEKFQYNKQARYKIRENLKIKDSTIVGVYVGKFGGIYYNKEAFHIFKQSYCFFKKNFFLMILTDHNHEELKNELGKVNFPLESCFFSKVPHSEVCDYLSASDFAFSTIKPSKSRRFCSPIKNGEYWANGLPILLTEGVGDDCEIISKDGGGLCLIYVTKIA